MAATIEDIINRIRVDRKALGLTLRAGVSDKEIAQFENTLKLKLPNDFKTFYKFCNGFEYHEDLFCMLSLQDIIANKKDPKLITNESLFKIDKLDTNEFIIAEYMIYIDTWVVQLNPNNHNEYAIDILSDTLCLTDSLAAFLTIFLNNGLYGHNGLLDMREKILGNNKM